jgi:uncharacterized membrane protein
MSTNEIVPAPQGAGRRVAPESATVGATRRVDPLRLITQVLALVGVGIAGYLTYVHYTGLTPVCAISHGCETVQSSQWADLAGVPVALLGLISYVVILACSFARGERGLLGGYALTVVAWAFSMYLTYRELFSIHAICSWCVSSAIVLTLLAIVGTVRVLRAEF